MGPGMMFTARMKPCARRAMLCPSMYSSACSRDQKLPRFTTFTFPATAATSGSRKWRAIRRSAFSERRLSPSTQSTKG